MVDANDSWMVDANDSWMVDDISCNMDFVQRMIHTSVVFFLYEN